MKPEQSDPSVVPEVHDDADDAYDLDLTVEKLGPRLALDNTEGGLGGLCGGVASNACR
jgi:hypothetical protein